MRLAPDEHLSEFRREFEHWLDRHMPSPDVMTEARRSSAHLPDWARAWQRDLFENGWLVPGWPPELGGRNATPEEQMTYFEVVAERQVPRALNPQGLSICAASIIDFGTEEQRERFAIPTLRGEVTWCVGMSEPDAGSDLASLSTRAERRGDRFVVNGQKVWTSGAHEADLCMCYVRTDPDAPKHRGISILIVDMRTPGIECRPLPELTDPRHADFNEVFFTDVEVPAENLVGELHGGWALAQGSLRHERAMLWIMNVATFDRAVEGLLRMAGRDGGDGRLVGEDPRFADALAELAMDARAMRCLGYRGFAKARRGEMPPEHVILKLFTSEAERRATLLGFEALGAGGLDLDGPGPNRRTDFDLDRYGPAPVDVALTAPFADGPWAAQYLRSFAGTIAGGTSEIQRNIIAERVLGMPRS
ncbi:MAG: acyl-CoA dehydrogenase family protein [Actinomycetota bacterium]|nr:acyl-CoA dehydrogenase family protein [Actinomycetota bacterium]